MKNNLIVRKVIGSDTAGLVELFESIWPDISYSKKNKVNFVVMESTGVNYCVCNGSEIVGSRLSIPINFMYGSIPLKCIQLCDTCVRPEFRRKGLMTQMNSKLIDDFFSDSEERKIIWNVGVAASRSVNEKMGWQYLDCFKSLIKVVRPLRVFSKVGISYRKLLGDVMWEMNNQIINIDENLLRIRENTMLARGLLHTNYTVDYMLWRMQYKSGVNQFHDNELGDILYKIGRKSGLVFVLIGEIFMTNYEKKSVRELIKRFERLIAPDIIKIALSKSHPLYLGVKQAKFINLHTLNLGVNVIDKNMQRFCLNPGLWAISMLDVDTF